MPSSTPPPLPMPCCYVCDWQGPCNVSRIGNDLHVELCPDHHLLFVGFCTRYLQSTRVHFGLPPRELERVTLGPPPAAPRPRLRALPSLADALSQVPSKPNGKGDR